MAGTMAVAPVCNASIKNVKLKLKHLHSDIMLTELGRHQEKLIWLNQEEIVISF